MRPVASVDQVMDGIVIPASQRVFDAVVYVNGKLEQSPKTEDEWFGIQMQALAVAEGAPADDAAAREGHGRLLTFSRALTDSAYRVRRRPKPRPDQC